MKSSAEVRAGGKTYTLEEVAAELGISLRTLYRDIAAQLPSGCFIDARAFPDKACYDCHLQHASDDLVWVQFYPTLRKLRDARQPRADKYIKIARETAVRVIPPLIVVTLLVVIWELVCRRAGSALPPPSKVYADTKELIFDPFFDRGGIDKGLFWHLSASLQRVAFGYSLAAVAGTEGSWQEVGHYSRGLHSPHTIRSWQRYTATLRDGVATQSPKCPGVSPVAK